MAQPDRKALVTVGPFKGLDNTTADLYVPAGTGNIALNTDTNRVNQGLTNAQGRTLYYTFPGSGEIETVAFYNPLTNDPSAVVCIFTGSGYQTQVFDQSTMTAYEPANDGTYFDQAVQFSQILYFNNGQQLQGNYPQSGSDPIPALHPWQFPSPSGGYSTGPYSGPFIDTTTTADFTIPPFGGTVTVSVASGASFPNGTWVEIVGSHAMYGYVQTGGGTMNLVIVNVAGPNSDPPGDTITTGATVYATMQGDNTYYYAITRVYATLPHIFTAPDFSGYGPQETNAYGDDYPYPLVNNSGLQNVISGPFSGTSPDGVPWTSNIYRLSTNQPSWYLLAANVSGTQYIDTQADQYILGNAQLVTTRDPPPVSADNLGAIEAHKDRMWCFAVVNNPDTNNQPQIQLWYSGEDRPWEFDSVNQVLLVGTADVPYQAGNSYTGYADLPVGLASLGSVLMAFKSRSTWTIWGQDQLDFVPIKAFDIGCLSRRSITKGPGFVFWLSEEGAYVYDGSTPTNITMIDVRKTLNATPLSVKQASVGSFANLTWYLSFPAAEDSQSFTLAYYIPTKTWRTLPYAMNACAYQPANPISYGATYLSGQILASRNGGLSLDNWNTSENDLGASIAATWQTPLSNAGQPAYRKIYEYIVLEAPHQPGATATVTLTTDPGTAMETTFTRTFDLSGPTRQIAAVSNKPPGFLAQLSITFTTAVGQLDPTVIYSCSAWGYIEQELTIQQ